VYVNKKCKYILLLLFLFYVRLSANTNSGIVDFSDILKSVTVRDSVTGAIIYATVLHDNKDTCSVEYKIVNDTVSFCYKSYELNDGREYFSVKTSKCYRVLLNSDIKKEIDKMQKYMIRNDSLQNDERIKREQRVLNLGDGRLRIGMNIDSAIVILNCVRKYNRDIWLCDHDNKWEHHFKCGKYSIIATNNLLFDIKVDIEEND
jgi:hypothetical protein